MVVVENGTILNGAISLDRPLPIADGSQVVVRVETATPATPSETPPATPNDLASHPFFGQWADRKDIPDSSDYVRQEREKWQLRATRRD